MLNIAATIKDRDVLCDQIEEAAVELALKGEQEVADCIHMAVVSIKQAVADALHVHAAAQERLDKAQAVESERWAREALGRPA